MTGFVIFLISIIAIPLSGMAWIAGIAWGQISQGFRLGMRNYAELDDPRPDKTFTETNAFSEMERRAK